MRTLWIVVLSFSQGWLVTEVVMACMGATVPALCVALVIALPIGWAIGRALP